MINFEFKGGWNPAIRRMAMAAVIVPEVIDTVLIEVILKEGVDTVHQTLEETVYSTAAEKPERRTGRTYEAVKGQKHGMMAGKLYIDFNIANRGGFPYPVVLEHGRKSTPRYYGRHYWRLAKQRLAVRYERQGMFALIRIKQLLGAAGV